MSQLILPEPFASIPKENFLFGPSPIQHLPNISAKLGGKVGVYAKREDCNSGLAYGGNKVRKLEYVYAIALHAICKFQVVNKFNAGTSPPKHCHRAPIPLFQSEVFNLTTLAQSLR